MFQFFILHNHLLKRFKMFYAKKKKNALWSFQWIRQIAANTYNTT